jgi:hypothetical protein
MKNLRTKLSYAFYTLLGVLKLKHEALKKAIWTYVFRLAKEADKIKNFITR